MIREILNIILVLVFVSLISLYLKISAKHKTYPSPCPVFGPGSAEPRNVTTFLTNLGFAVRSVLDSGQRVVVYTTVNAEAATNNLPHFLTSCAKVSPSLIPNVIIFCLDSSACRLCESAHPVIRCVHMDLGVSGGSLAPGVGDQTEKDYWRLTYGRVFATLKIHSFNISVLTVDVDSVFFRNPLAPGEAIAKRPNDIALVTDRKQFNIQVRDKSVANGGFIYFPATTPRTTSETREIINRIWSHSCFPSKSEQMVTSKVLRDYYQESVAKGKTFSPSVLSKSHYLSYCNTDCNNSNFSSITSVKELQKMEKSFTGQPNERACRPNNRRQWVFFHMACIAWPHGRSEELSAAKGQSQQAMLEWVAA